MAATSISDAAAAAASARNVLTACKADTYTADGTLIELYELTAEQAVAIWEDLTALEAAGRTLDIYRLLILHAAYVDGQRVFDSLEQTLDIPIRHLVPLGERILQLCDMGLEANPEIGQGESLPAV